MTRCPFIGKRCDYQEQIQDEWPQCKEPDRLHSDGHCTEYPTFGGCPHCGRRLPEGHMDGGTCSHCGNNTGLFPARNPVTKEVRCVHPGILCYLKVKRKDLFPLCGNPSRLESLGEQNCPNDTVEPTDVKKCATCYWMQAKPPQFGCYFEQKWRLWIVKSKLELPTDCVLWKKRPTVVAETRPVSERNPEGDRSRLNRFADAMFAKWQKGRQEYGTEMRMDPFAEAKNECVDLANYSMEIWDRLNKLEQKAKALQDKYNSGGN